MRRQYGAHNPEAQRPKVRCCELLTGFDYGVNEMGIQVFESEEDMDDAFEDMMEAEQEKARLRELIEEAEYEVECRQADLDTAKEELAGLEKQLSDLDAS